MVAGRFTWKERAASSLRQMQELAPSRVSVQVRSVWPLIAELLKVGYGYPQIADHLRSKGGIGVSAQYLRAIASHFAG